MMKVVALNWISKNDIGKTVIENRRIYLVVNIALNTKFSSIGRFRELLVNFHCCAFFIQFYLYSILKIIVVFNQLCVDPFNFHRIGKQ